MVAVPVAASDARRRVAVGRCRHLALQVRELVEQAAPGGQRRRCVDAQPRCDVRRTGRSQRRGKDGIHQTRHGCLSCLQRCFNRFWFGLWDARKARKLDSTHGHSDEVEMG